MLKSNHHYPFSPHDQTTVLQPTSSYHIYNAFNAKPTNEFSTSHSTLFKWTPHIHLTIIHSILSNLAISSTFIAQVSLAYLLSHDTLDTVLYFLFHFERKNIQGLYSGHSFTVLGYAKCILYICITQLKKWHVAIM